MIKKIFFYRILFFTILIFFPPEKTFSQNLFINKLNDLNFGDLFIGYSKEVFDTDINAAKFRFYHTYPGNRNFTLNFNLPTHLTNGVNTIPVTFDQNHTSWSFNDQISGRTRFDPFLSNYPINRVRTNINIYVWLGGILSTSVGIPPGIYQGTIVLTVDVF